MYANQVIYIIKESLNILFLTLLQVEVLNGRNLIPMDDNGLCDPFVRLHFIPEERFQNIAKPKTNAIAKTLFPLFDEKFAM